MSFRNTVKGNNYLDTDVSVDIPTDSVNTVNDENNLSIGVTT